MLRTLSCTVLSALVVVPPVANAAPPTFDDDLAFLRQHTEVVVLEDASGARVAVVPAWQGRVMTSTVGGAAAPSYGWINRELVASRRLLPHINAFGGEDRLWLGPEGGQYSIFFRKGDPFDLDHWQTPPLIDTEAWTVKERGSRHVAFRRDGHLVNYTGTPFELRLERSVRLLEREAAARQLGLALPASLKLVAFESENLLVNTGKAAWTKAGGLLSIWILGMFQPSPRTTVVIPYREGPESALGPIVNDAYFGTVPADRLLVKGGLVFFKGDGERRSKIGLSPERATGILASYDASRGLLTLVSYTRPAGAADYVNSMWEIQQQPFRGDAVNSYNDGPPAPGAKPLGPFYELESSSPAAALAPGESLGHAHRTFHFQGARADIDALARRLLGVSLEAVESSLAIPPDGAVPGAIETRGVGVYPGDPREDFAPVLVPDTVTYRNLALRRPAYQSSAYDYNLTAQLVTDGLREATLPRWLETSTSQGGLSSKVQRELLVDHSSTSALDLDGKQAWVQFTLAGGDSPLAVDRIELEMRPRRPPPWGPPGEASSPEAFTGGSEWTVTVSGSDDGQAWKELGRTSGTLPEAPPPPPGEDWTARFAWFRGASPTVRPSIALGPPSRARSYRVSLEFDGGPPWALAEVAFFDGSRRVEVGGPYGFASAWMPEGKGEEWVSVDLGARCSFDRIALHWIRRAAEGSIQTSDDGATWRDVWTLEAGAGPTDDIRLPRLEQGRYVRVLLRRPASPEGYVLSELSVFGRGGQVARPKSAPPWTREGRLHLAGGAWRLQRDSLVKADGATLSRPGFRDADWVVATVPATVLSSYWNAGALPDPNYGDNQLAISDSFFYADFWYRTEFEAARLRPGQRAFLGFDGVNWKAEVFLNGERLGRVEGAFTRGRFDVTRQLRPGKTNALAVRAFKNATPGSAKQKTLESAGLNGGALGADNPTYHASIGWDWIPTVRGRATGLWNDVHLDVTGPVTIEDPFVRTTLPLPDTSRADVRLSLSLANHEPRPVGGTLRGRFGDVAFEQAVALEAGSTKTVVLDPSSHPVLRLDRPRLWWPNGYGEASLYDVSLAFEVDGTVSDTKAFRAGVRQFSYSEEAGALRIWVNGRRFVARGGNWGFPETNLRYRGREYDVAVRYHRDMNFTMIRNWVGQTGDDEFYEACDRHGIVVWQDFWLANPFDGPDPDDDGLFLRNVRDTLLRIRNHPSLGLYCGRNEGYPPPALDAGIRTALAELHSDIHYIPNSAWDVVSGGGPYGVRTPKFYFQERATPKLHSELGMPAIVNYDSLRAMMEAAALWPPGLAWGLHDFNLGSAQRLSDFRALVDTAYGGAENAADWVGLAQLVNYDGYRAMFEAQGRNRMGLLLWMSHPAWPSFVWQTYDYFFDPTAAYFGSRKGAEPLHIQWNPVSDEVEVVNYSAGAVPGLVARAEALDLDGKVRWQASASVDSVEDGVEAPLRMEFPAPLTPVHFVRLTLTRGDALVSENFYWRGALDGDLRALRTLPKVELEATTRSERQGERLVLTTELVNPSDRPALMVRVAPVRARSGDRILPALFSDNYVALMPGERRSIRTELEAKDARGEEPRIVVDGFNVAVRP